MYGGRYMKRYTGEELNVKIHTFLYRKFEQYPELDKPTKGRYVTNQA